MRLHSPPHTARISKRLIFEHVPSVARSACGRVAPEWRPSGARAAPEVRMSGRQTGQERQAVCDGVEVSGGLVV